MPKLVGRRGNPLKAMSNRTGKREREARNRSKRRCWVYSLSPDGAPVGALKLGRKKQSAFSSASSRPSEWGSITVYSPRVEGVTRLARMAAVPVAEAESRMTGPKEPNRLADSPSTPSDDGDAA